MHINSNAGEAINQWKANGKQEREGEGRERERVDFWAAEGLYHIFIGHICESEYGNSAKLA